MVGGALSGGGAGAIVNATAIGGALSSVGGLAQAWMQLILVERCRVGELGCSPTRQRTTNSSCINDHASSPTEWAYGRKSGADDADCQQWSCSGWRTEEVRAQANERFRARFELRNPQPIASDEVIEIGGAHSERVVDVKLTIESSGEVRSGADGSGATMCQEDECLFQELCDYLFRPHSVYLCECLFRERLCGNRGTVIPVQLPQLSAIPAQREGEEDVFEITHLQTPAVWRRYQDPSTGWVWFMKDGTVEFFFRNSPGEWRQFISMTGRCLWLNLDSLDNFFEDECE